MSKRVEITKNELIEAINMAKNKAKKRRFKQSIELIISINGLDLRRPENRIVGVIKLPHKPSKSKKVAIFADGIIAEKAKEAGIDAIISEKELEAISGSKKEGKKLAKAFDFFLAEPKLMAKIGKILGFALGPRGKMPQIVTPATNLKEVIENLRSSVRVNVRNNPMVALSIGDEDMDNDKLADNAMAVINFINSKIIDKNARIKRIYVKTTMGPSIRVI